MGERLWAGRFVRTFFLRDRRGGPWPAPDWLPHEPFRFEGNTGADLAARWFAARDAHGTVVLAHPDRRYGQHWFIVSGWVDWLHDRGYNVLTFDFPDYGESRGGSTYYYEDALAAAQEARRRGGEGPLHLVGLSMGAFAIMNASPYLRDVDSVVLESPYPTFNAWYGRGAGAWGMAAFDRLFPATAPRIDGLRNLSQSRARRILVAASGSDAVTPVELSRAVAEASPPARTRYLEVDGVAHLDLFWASPTYRDAVLATLEGRPVPASARPLPLARGMGRASTPRSNRGDTPKSLFELRATANRVRPRSATRVPGSEETRIPKHYRGMSKPNQRHNESGDDETVVKIWNRALTEDRRR